MKCKEIDLIAYYDKQLSDAEEQAVREHLRTCRSCAEQYEAILSALEALTNIWRGLRSDCLSPEKISSYFYNELPHGERDELKAHFEKCSICREKLVLLKTFEQVAERIEPVESELPEAVVASLRRLRDTTLKDRLVKSIETFVQKGSDELQKGSGTVDRVLKNLLTPGAVPQAAVRKNAADVQKKYAPKDREESNKKSADGNDEPKSGKENE